MARAGWVGTVPSFNPKEAPMDGYTMKAIDEMGATHQGLIKLAGAELGLRSFGMQVLDIPAGSSDYPEHDHAEDGQEEVYVVLRGSADMQMDGERVSLSVGQMIRVAPNAKRKLVPGEEGARVLAIGAAAGRPYQRPGGFELEVQA
jgi:mannose-6-phosphate isomerase-like protein (cupin superfamily)